MSDLIKDQKAVVASLQKRLKTLTDGNVAAGHIKDVAMALAASIDKLEVLVIGSPRLKPGGAHGPVNTIAGELGPVGKDGRALVFWPGDKSSSYVHLGVEIDADAQARLVVLDYERQPPLPPAACPNGCKLPSACSGCPR